MRSKICLSDVMLCMVALYSDDDDDDSDDVMLVQAGIMELSAVKDVKGFSSGASGSSWATHAEATRSVQSRSIIATAASIVACRSALLLACALTVSHCPCFLFVL